jgi:glutathione peroxidase-family protein
VSIKTGIKELKVADGGRMFNHIEFSDDKTEAICTRYRIYHPYRSIYNNKVVRDGIPIKEQYKFLINKKGEVVEKYLGEQREGVPRAEAEKYIDESVKLGFVYEMAEF